MAKQTEAQKRAHQNYMERFAKAEVRMERDQYESVQIHAEDRGESVNGFINRAIEETMKRDDGAQAMPSGGLLTLKGLQTAQAEVRKTGETLQQFVERAIREAAERPTEFRQAAVSLPLETLEAAKRAADAAGESVAEFVERAVELVALQETGELFGESDS